MVDAIPNSPYNNGKDNIGVKVATPQYILFDDAGVSIENMTRLVFEDIGSEEIINVARNDTVFGENLIYQPIVNSVSLSQKYNSTSILSLQGTIGNYFKNFTIELSNKIPNVGSGPNGEFIYIDDVTGDLIIDAVNMESDEQIEINIITDGESYRDTI